MTTTQDKSAGRVLLPNYITPVNYDLKLVPDLVKFTFDGLLTIQFDASANVGQDESKKITLHSKELLYKKASVTLSDGKEVVAETISVNNKATTVTFEFAEPVIVSNTKCELKIDFVGELNNQMAGFYRSTYEDTNGNEKIVASTQFEALDARRCFPCVDEPAAKATFDVTLVVPRHLECFSNMPESKRISLDGDLVEISFLKTPKMSTYLLAMCVGEFDFLQAQNEHGVLIRVYAPRGRSESCSYALECACKALDEYDNFFGVHYPLPKLDMVAIPEFAMGAMENWGLVTYRDVDLLIDPLTASNKQKQRVCTVVCHELAHQWFGNLVTMQWWDDLWLNEGFASWAENWSANSLFPDYKMWDQFVTDHLSSALKLDALESSHPIQVPIAHAEEVEQVFDAISYCKGGAVVKMICAVLGMPNFQKGLAEYMAKHAYGNTETFHLWQSWEQVSGMPIQEMMASWTEQMGFPVLKVIGEEWTDTSVTLELEQSWFLADGSTPSLEKTWTIPILTKTKAGDQADMTLMREKTAKVTIPLSGTGDWVKLNAGQEVPMRVQYSPEMLSRLSQAVSSNELTSASDRVGLIMDAYALVKANCLEPEALLQLLASYKNESNTIVWQGLADALGGLETVLSDDTVIYENLKKFAQSLLLPLVEKIGWDASPEDGHLTSILRGTMISLLSTFCSTDDKVKEQANTRVNTFLEDNSTGVLPTDIKVPVFKIYLKNGSTEEYEKIKGYFYSAKDNAERKHVLNTLGSISSVELKKATLEWTTSGEVKLQDFFYAIGSVGRSGKAGRELTWGYFQEHHTRLAKMLANASPSLTDAVIVLCAGGFCSTEKADEIDQFFEKNPYPKNSRKIAQMTENMRANGKFLATLQKSKLSDASFWEGL